MKYTKQIIFTFLLLSVQASCFAFTQAYRISYLNIDDGLPQNEVTGIIQDQKGFMWFATRGGLARYDGYAFKTFQNEPGNPNSLSNNSIETIFEDSEGLIWLGTKSGGVSVYDPVSGNFSNYLFNANDPGSISGNRVISIAEDHQGNIWLGTWQNGLNKFDKKTGQFKRYLSGKLIHDLMVDEDDILWITTYSSISKFDVTSDTFIALDEPVQFKHGSVTTIAEIPNTSQLWAGGWNEGLTILNKKSCKRDTTFLHNPKNQQSISSNNSYKVFVDSQHQTWIGTWNGGLNLFNPKENTFSTITLTPSHLGNLNNVYKMILCIYEDRSGIIWLGTNGGGICKIDKRNQTIKHIHHHENDPQSLNNGHILSLIEDSHQNIWVGTKGGGLSYSADNGKTFTYVKQLSASANDNYRVNTTKCIYEDQSGYIWVGTNFGLHQLSNQPNSANKTIRTFRKSQQNQPLSGNKISVIFGDSKGRFWVGTQQSGLNLRIGDYSSETPLFKQYAYSSHNQDSLRSERISCMFQDSQERLWVGTYGGLHLYLEDRDAFRQFYHISGDTSTLTSDIILCMNEDKNGNLWIGTPNGLNRLQFQKDSSVVIRNYGIQDGFRNNYIHAILPHKDELWISTNDGIYRFNPQTSSMKMYDVSDGLQSRAFTEGVAFKGVDNKMYFGGINGYNCFHPDSLKDNPYIPDNVITGIKVYNQPVLPGKQFEGDVILQKSITYTEGISLSYLNNVFTISFASLNYHAPEKNQYAYKLEGHDNRWVQLGKNRNVTFSNLPPGNYTFKVKGSNNSGFWNDKGTSLAIEILPPPWKTKSAFLGYFLLACILVIVIRSVAVKQTNLENALQLVALEKEKEQEINEMKFRFFTNVSHEFRTPLTLITAPMEELLMKQNLSDIFREKLLLMYKNSQKLLHLVNQLMDLRKIESGNMRLLAQEGNLVSFTHEVFLSFQEMANQKNIHYQFQKEVDQLNVWFDHDKLEMVITNLLSNAFKYTKSGGTIRCCLKQSKNKVEIIIRDNGIGIAPEALSKIFDRYYQVVNTDEVKTVGTGIGLALVKDLMELHQGKISVQSTLNEGTEFVLELPLGKDHLHQEQIVPQNIPETTQLQDKTEPLITVTENDSSEIDLANSKENKPKLVMLIVEDNKEIRSYLKSIFTTEYKVFEAEEGKQGVAMANEEIPDIIISDVMMEPMNGIELCKELKSNQNTSHIPIILLTARTMINHEIEGLSTGADDYIKKPFNPELLKARIKNIIASRETLKTYYGKKITLEPTDIEITFFDEKFLEKAMTFVEQHIQTEGFNTQHLMKEMGMSQSALYRKLKALTGLSIIDFIRSVRLKRAAQLLKTNEFTVNEVAFQTGFSEVKYFRKYFKQQFSCTPTAYKKEHSKIKD